MALLWLPDAAHDVHSSKLNPWTTTQHPKGCLHTTETESWPGYAHWTIMPHATVRPITGHGVEVRQHIPFSSGSFALKNEPGGVQTNRAFVFQFELIGTCSASGPGYHWPSADDAVLLDLWRKVIKPLSVAYRIPLRAPVFKPYLAVGRGGSYGTNNGVRLTNAQWTTFSGWLGHQHVPENDHGDPGAFPFARLMKLASKDTPLPKPPTPPAHEPTIEELVKLFIYAEGDDRLILPAAQRATGAVTVTDRGTVTELIKAGARVVVLGGPAIASLKMTWSVKGKVVTHGHVVAVHGNTFQQTAAWALVTA